MRAFVAKTAIGIVAFSEKGEVVAYESFPKDAAAAAAQLEKPVPERFLSKLKGYEVVEDARSVRGRVRALALSSGFAEDDAAFNAFLSALGAAVSLTRMRGAIGRDRFLIQALHALDDVNSALHVAYQRIEEWYRLHYPELAAEKLQLAEQIARHGSREQFPGFHSSVGTALTERDTAAIQTYAQAVIRIREAAAQTEGYIKSTARELMPNVCSVIEPMLAARLLAAAGSHEKLARMTASGIQLIGAEKALFRHLKKQGKSPKYGLLFFDARIQNADKEKRGKVARILAAKLMLAARIDFYSGRTEKKLATELNEELKAV